MVTDINKVTGVILMGMTAWFGFNVLTGRPLEYDAETKLSKTSCCCGADEANPCACMKQKEAMQCSATEPMCLCYKELAEKKAAEYKKMNPIEKPMVVGVTSNITADGLEDLMMAESNFDSLKKLKKLWREEYEPIGITYEEMLVGEVIRLRDRLKMNGFDPDAKLWFSKESESFSAEDDCDCMLCGVVSEKEMTQDDELCDSCVKTHGQCGVCGDIELLTDLHTSIHSGMNLCGRCENYDAESFNAEDDMVICGGCEQERYSDSEFSIDNARSDVLDDGNVLCDYCWDSHDKYVENAESFSAEATPIRHSRRLNGYYGIKGYEDASEDGFIYRIYRSPGTNDWFKAMVYDDNSRRESGAKHTSRRLNPSGKMTISNDPASLLIGAFPKFEDAKRALVFRMIQDGNYHHMITDGNLKWLLKGNR